MMAHKVQLPSSGERSELRRKNTRISFSRWRQRLTWLHNQSQATENGDVLRTTPPIPGTEILIDERSGLSAKSSLDIILVPEPSRDSHDPLVSPVKIITQATAYRQRLTII